MKRPDKKPEHKVGEKGFGTCRECGKKTMGRSNDLCSRCGGTPVHELLGITPEPPFAQTYFGSDGSRHVKRGYHAARVLAPEER